MFGRWRTRKEPKIVTVNNTLLKVTFTTTCLVSQEVMAGAEKVCLFRSQSIELSDCSTEEVDRALAAVAAEYEGAGMRAEIVD
jgi:hypothetical protein